MYNTMIYSKPIIVTKINLIYTYSFLNLIKSKVKRLLPYQYFVKY